MTGGAVGYVEVMLQFYLEKYTFSNLNNIIIKNSAADSGSGLSFLRLRISDFGSPSNISEIS